MQIRFNVNTNNLVGTEFQPDYGGTSRTTGHFFVPMPYSVGIEVDSSSYLIPQDSGSIPGQLSSELLVRFPMYDHILFEFFLESADIGDLDLSTVAGVQPTAATVANEAPPAFSPNVPCVRGARCQVGRSGAAPVGIAPNSVAMLNRRDQTYGAILTNAVDISGLNPTNPGTDEVMMWWELARPSVSEDVLQGFGATSGQNSPAAKTLERLDPETSGVYVYASVDDGASWYRVEYLEPTDLANAGSDLRVCFINTTGQKVYLLGYAVLFPDLP